MQFNFNYRIGLFKKYLREKGFKFTVKKITFFLIRPLIGLVKKNLILIEFFYGTLPNLKQKLPILRVNSGIIKFPQSELVNKVSYFWYSNIPGDFNLNEEKISRRDIFIYGGPNPKFTCQICQKCEWLSRIRQKNLFILHSCKHSEEREHNEECKILCSRQGDELWTNFHQNFDFSIDYDANLTAPKCLCIMPDDRSSEAGGFYQRFQTPCCDQWMLLFRRRLAYACQVDVVKYPININWKNYDFILMPNTGSNRKFPHPDIPVILYGHDFWPLENKGYQWVIDWVQPDILLTPYPTQWRGNFKLPLHTKVVFYPFFESLFFSRPNLIYKQIDLLVIGTISSPIYGPRVSLKKQISQLEGRYKIEFFHSLPESASWKGGTYRVDPINKTPIRYLNKWSEYLGSAKYVIFGRMQFPILVSKYYEVLGSGAIAIFPEVPDLNLLGIKPFEHYIPLSEVEGRRSNERLSYFLDNYDKFRYVAENAVNWYKENSDKMLFNDFEDVIEKITNHQFPKRLI